MELYFAPLACSLATRISLYEAGAADARADSITRATIRLMGADLFSLPFTARTERPGSKRAD